MLHALHRLTRPCRRRPAGTNYAVRAQALAQVGWFPTYTVGEDYALGMELKQVRPAGCTAQWARGGFVPPTGCI